MSTQVRLTGKHPFNVEPPLPLLMAHGHSTPASIHYVRNHGKVPVAYAGESDILKIEREWRVALPAGHGVASTAALSLVPLVYFTEGELLMRWFAEEEPAIILASGAFVCLAAVMAFLLLMFELQK